MGIWNPDDEYWGEEGDPVEKWATPIIARGPTVAPRMGGQQTNRMPGAGSGKSRRPMACPSRRSRCTDSKCHRGLCDLARKDEAGKRWVHGPYSDKERLIRAIGVCDVMKTSVGVGD
jgi:hypothetical protein